MSELDPVLRMVAVHLIGERTECPRPRDPKIDSARLEATLPRYAGGAAKAWTARSVALKRRFVSLFEVAWRLVRKEAKPTSRATMVDSSVRLILPDCDAAASVCVLIWGYAGYARSRG